MYELDETVIDPWIGFNDKTSQNIRYSQLADQLFIWLVMCITGSFMLGLIAGPILRP